MVLRRGNVQGLASLGTGSVVGMQWVGVGVGMGQRSRDERPEESCPSSHCDRGQSTLGCVALRFRLQLSLSHTKRPRPCVLARMLKGWRVKGDDRAGWRRTVCHSALQQPTSPCLGAQVAEHWTQGWTRTQRPCPPCMPWPLTEAANSLRTEKG